jgi:hypothetical protein
MGKAHIILIKIIYYMININSNYSSEIASYRLNNVNSNLTKSIIRQSSGLKINSSIEDPAGLAVSMRLKNKVLQSSALNKNLSNTLSFLETQETYLKRIGKILTRVDEIDIQKNDLIKNAKDTAVYDNERSNLIAEIYKIRDEKFNGVSLFSPDSTMKSMLSDTTSINGESQVVEQPPLIWNNKNKPLELVFLCDYSPTMGDTRQDLINNINTFAADLNAKVAAGTIPSWKARVMVFGDWNGYKNNNFIKATSDFTNPASSDANQIKSQTTAFPFPMLSTNPPYAPGSQNPFEESPIDAIGYAVNNTTWSADSNKGMILFTDYGSMPPNGSFGSSLDIANASKSKGVELFIYGKNETAIYPNEELMTFVGQSGATFTEFANRGTMSSTLNNFIQSVLSPEGMIDFDTLTQYIGQNAAEQNRVKNLISSNDLLKNTTTAALGQIQDIDIAQESIKFARSKIMQEAGIAYVAHANVVHQSYHKLFE